MPLGRIFAENEAVSHSALVRYWLVSIAVLFVSCSSPLPPVNMTSEGVAIKGYDPVAYFTDGGPVKGSPDLQYEWHGAKWRFASREHLQLFRENPEKYAPQYGGY